MDILNTPYNAAPFYYGSSVTTICDEYHILGTPFLQRAVS